MKSDADPMSPESIHNCTTTHYVGELHLTGALRSHSLDAIAMPTPYSYLPSSWAGRPVIMAPMGRSPNGTPVRQCGDDGQNLTGPNVPFGPGFADDKFGETKPIEMPYAFEHRTRFAASLSCTCGTTTEVADVVRRW